jgi:NAD(P)-dependent dehydrogenase (short-subunit alcohol dehydrogenase family)
MWLVRAKSAQAEPERNWMSDLMGKVAIVTGGSKGIGAAAAKALAADAAAVVVNYSREKKALDGSSSQRHGRPALRPRKLSHPACPRKNQMLSREANHE